MVLIELELVVADCTGWLGCTCAGGGGGLIFVLVGVVEMGII